MILLFDSSTPTGMLALGTQVKVLSSATWMAEQSHSQKLQPQIEWALAEAKTTLAQLTHIAVGIGPGSFTGLRVALATAKGLGVALGIPIVAIPSLELFSAGCITASEEIVSTSDAFRNEIYVATCYRGLAPTDVKSMTPIHAIELIKKINSPVTLIGTGYARYKQQFDDALTGQLIPATAERDFSFMLARVEQYIRDGRMTDPVTVQPYYVRDAEAVEKKRQ